MVLNQALTIINITLLTAWGSPSDWNSQCLAFTCSTFKYKGNICYKWPSAWSFHFSPPTIQQNFPKVRTCQPDHKGNKPYRVSSVTISHHLYVVRAMHTLFIKLDLPTFGNPHTSRVLVLGSIDGSLATCCRTTNISEKSYGKIHL